MQELGRPEEVEMESDATNAGKLETRASMHCYRWSYSRCAVCRRVYEQHHDGVVSLSGDDEYLGDVCPDRVAAGKEGAAQRGRDCAQEMRQWAGELDQLVAEIPDIAKWATMEDLRAAAREAERAMTKGDTPHKDALADTRHDEFDEVDPFAEEEQPGPVKPISIDIDAWVADAIRLFPQICFIYLEGSRAFECDQPYSYYELLVGLEDDCYDGESVQIDKIEQRLAFHPSLVREGLKVFFLRPNDRLGRWAFAHDDTSSFDRIGDLPGGDQVLQNLKEGFPLGDFSRFRSDMPFGRRLYDRDCGQSPYPGEKQDWLKSAERLSEELVTVVKKFAANDPAATVMSATWAMSIVEFRMPDCDETLAAITWRNAELDTWTS